MFLLWAFWQPWQSPTELMSSSSPPDSSWYAWRVAFQRCFRDAHMVKQYYFSSFLEACVSATGVFTQIHSEVHYQLCLYEPFVNLLNTYSVVFTEYINPVVFLFVSGSVDSSSNTSASKRLVLSGTLSVIHPNCFQIEPAVLQNVPPNLLPRTNVTSFPRSRHRFLVRCWNRGIFRDRMLPGYCSTTVALKCSGRGVDKTDALMMQAVVQM